MDVLCHCERSEAIHGAASSERHPLSTSPRLRGEVGSPGRGGTGLTTFTTRGSGPSPPPSPREERGEGVAHTYAGTTLSLITKNFTRSIRPKLVVSATSAASRPVPIRMRPARGTLWRASKVYHWPER